MGSNAKKNETLGMPYGTAQNRLRKMILFSLAQQLEQDVCYRCGDIILSPEHLSIEHIEPWEGRSADLFWDLNNIAFSHLRCNTPHSYGEGREPRQFDGEFLTCCRCKVSLPVTDFWKDKSNWTGFQYYCKSCHKQAKG
jgi:hypothetical protein